MPNDFVVMDIKEDTLVPIILGRPFLATTGAVINVKEGLFTFTIGEEVVEFQFNKSMRNTSGEDCKQVSTDDTPTRELVEYILRDDPLELLLTHEEHSFA